MNIYLLFLALASTERPLAIVGSETLSCQEFRIQIATQGICDLSTENIEPLLQNWAEGLLLCHEAARLGLDQNETTQATLRNYERQYVIGMLTARLTDTVQVTANDIFDYFNRRRLDFATRLRFAYMVLPDEQTARQTIKELNSGKDFRQLAQERSLARTAVPLAETVLTGRLDTTVSLDPLLEDTIFSLPKGKVSPPIKVSTAWWLVKPLETSYLTDTVTLEQVRPFVTRLLELKRKRAIIENATTLLRRKARVRLPAKGDTSGLLAEVNGQRLTRRELNTWLENPELLRESELAQAAETWIRSELLYQEARRLGLGNDDSTRIVLLTRLCDPRHPAP
ncbi:MAG: peptidyl-prolyl cis-trans isomerase [candidate division WOR-3 bacterium]